MSTSTLRWVTTDGISGGDVTVTVGLSRSGVSTINGSPVLSSSGRKNAVGNSLFTFVVTMTAQGTDASVPGFGAINAAAALASIGAKGGKGVGSLALAAGALAGVGEKGAEGTSTIPLSATIDVTGEGTGTPYAQRVFLLTGGGDADFTTLALLPDGFTEAGGGDGYFDSVANLVVYAVRLVYDGVVDDHERPTDRLWRYFHFPPTQMALLLWRDGTVQETAVITDADLAAADDIIAGGHRWQGAPDSWQAIVLAAAGYTLESVTEE